MTLPLITIKAPCGCPLNEGHYCCPPWVDETNWPVSGGVLMNDKRSIHAVSLGVTKEKCPEPVCADSGPPHNLIKQEGNYPMIANPCRVDNSGDL